MDVNTFAKPQTFHTFKFPSQIKAMPLNETKNWTKFYFICKIKVLKVSKSNQEACIQMPSMFFFVWKLFNQQTNINCLGSISIFIALLSRRPKHKSGPQEILNIQGKGLLKEKVLLSFLSKFPGSDDPSKIGLNKGLN